MTVMNLMAGKVALPGDDAYARARQIWNAAVDHRPALFAFCETAEDVQSALQIARVHGLPLSVRGEHCHGQRIKCDVALSFGRLRCRDHRCAPPPCRRRRPDSN